MPGSPSADGKMTAMLVDDEQLALEELSFLLKSFPEIEVVGQAVDGPSALERIEAIEPDIVFMDVRMPGLSGLGVVRELLARGAKLPHIVFATAYDQYAVEAFEVNAADYLLEPVDKARLGQSIVRARELLRSPSRESQRMASLLARMQAETAPPAKVLVRSGSRMVLVGAADVIFATVKDGAVHIVATDLDGYSNYKTLDDLQSTLGDRLFWRAHRSFLVNIDRIKEVIPWFKSSYHLRMKGGPQVEIPVSRAQTKRLRELFHL